MCYSTLCNSTHLLLAIIVTGLWLGCRADFKPRICCYETVWFGASLIDFLVNLFSFLPCSRGSRQHLPREVVIRIKQVYWCKGLRVVSDAWWALSILIVDTQYPLSVNFQRKTFLAIFNFSLFLSNNAPPLTFPSLLSAQGFGNRHHSTVGVGRTFSFG